MNEELFKDIQKNNEAEQNANSNTNNEIIPKSIENMLSEHGKEFLNEVLLDEEE